MPDRIDVKVKVNKSDFHPADTIVAAISATNFSVRLLPCASLKQSLILSEKAFQVKILTVIILQLKH